MYGRTNPGDVPFSNNFRPGLLNSNLNTYNDYRNGFYIPRSTMQIDDLLGSKSYFSFKSANNGFGIPGRGELEPGSKHPGYRRPLRPV